VVGAGVSPLLVGDLVPEEATGEEVRELGALVPCPTGDPVLSVGEEVGIFVG